MIAADHITKHWADVGEIQCLIDHYAETGPDVALLIKTKTRRQCMFKALRMGLRMSKSAFVEMHRRAAIDCNAGRPARTLQPPKQMMRVAFVFALGDTLA